MSTILLFKDIIKSAEVNKGKELFKVDTSKTIHKKNGTSYLKFLFLDANENWVKPQMKLHPQMKLNKTEWNNAMTILEEEDD